MQTATFPRPPTFGASRAPDRFVARMTPAEYHSFNRQAVQKHEFIEGEVIRMAGASVEHTYIQADLLVELSLLLRQVAGRAYRAVGSDLKVYVNSNVFVYPDIVIIPAKPQIDQNEAVRNPAAVVEILSSSTEAYDRNEKFALYQQVESLRHYVLVEQDFVSVTHYEKDEAGVWILAGVYENHADMFPLSLGDAQITVSVNEIYRSVTFDE